MQFATNTISYILYIFGGSYFILTANSEETEQSNEENWLYFVDEEGVNHIMNYSTVPHDTKDMVLGDAYFYLYTRNNQMKPELLTIPGDDSLLESTYFNKSNDIRVITHGWITSENATWLQNIKNTFLQEYDLNVITVDWGELSKNIIYPFAACSTRYVGKRVAKLLDVLIKTYNVKGDSMHLIGHSLGAQVMGYAGMFCSQRVLRVTGLDPARPLFEFPEMADDFRLDKSDANFVDVIHTCGGLYGYRESHGHADFYPNNGQAAQPGCGEMNQYAEGCSHGRAYVYFEESIEYRPGFGFKAYPCESWKKYESGECNDNPSEMGYMTNMESRGNYYLRTRNESKYVT